MSIATKVFWVIAIIIWISSLILLIVAIVDLLPNTSLKENRLIIGIGFLAISGIIRNAYKKQEHQGQ